MVALVCWIISPSVNRHLCLPVSAPAWTCWTAQSNDGSSYICKDAGNIQVLCRFYHPGDSANKQPDIKRFACKNSSATAIRLTFYPWAGMQWNYVKRAGANDAYTATYLDIGAPAQLSLQRVQQLQRCQWCWKTCSIFYCNHCWYCFYSQLSAGSVLFVG